MECGCRWKSLALSLRTDEFGIRARFSEAMRFDLAPSWFSLLEAIW